MARRGRPSGDDAETTIERIERVLERWPAGMHDLGEPGTATPLDWPATLQELYMTWDGLRLFGEAIELVPAAEVVVEDGRWRIGVGWGDELQVDARGRVWRDDDSVWTCDGTSIDRWLSGAIDAEAMLYQPDGEWADDVFDDDGEFEPSIAIARARAQLRRDGKAPGPRLRLARMLRLADDDTRVAARDEARDLLEGLVGDEPTMAWAWHELARISEELGELDGATDEATAAAEAAHQLGQDDEAFFWAHAARLAALRGDEPRRAAAATRAHRPRRDRRGAGRRRQRQPGRGRRRGRDRAARAGPGARAARPGRARAGPPAGDRA